MQVRAEQSGEATGLPSGQDGRSRVPLPDGRWLSCRTLGAGAPLVLLHGWSMSGAAFWPQDALAARGFHLVAPDLPGFGDSPAPPQPVSIPALADDLAAGIRALGLTRAVLVGWSMGAQVAWSCAARHGDLDLAGLVSIDMSPRIVNGPDWSLGLSDGHDGAATARTLASIAADWGRHRALFVPRIVADPLASSGVLVRLAAIARATGPASAGAAWSALAAHDSRPDLPRIGVPALVAHGARSRLYAPAVADWVAGQLPRATIARFASSGHAPHLEEAEAFNDTLARFASAAAGRDPATDPVGAKPPGNEP